MFILFQVTKKVFMDSGFSFPQWWKQQTFSWNVTF